MPQNNNTAVYYPKTVQEALMLRRSNPHAEFYAGAMSITYGTTSRIIQLPRSIISIGDIPELKTINKTERYIEIGSAVTLSAIIDLGKKNIPQILYNAIQHTGNYCIRNNATLGGNILTQTQYLSLFAVLIALDAKVEIRTLNEATWKTLHQFSHDNKKSKATVLPPQIVTRIRIPLISSSVDIFEKVYTAVDALFPETFVMTVDAPNGIILDIRIAYAGTTFFRFREIENALAGHTIPIPSKEIDRIINITKDFLAEIQADVSKLRLLNFVRKSLETLS